MDRLTKWTSRLKWIIPALWILLAALSATALPDLPSVIQHTEQKFLPRGTESDQAGLLLDRIRPEDRSKSHAVIVLSRDGGLRPGDEAWLDGQVARLERDKEILGIEGVLSPRTQPGLKDLFRSRGGEALLAIITLPLGDFEEKTMHTVDRLGDYVDQPPAGASAKLTGPAPISRDFRQSIEEGMRRTEIFTAGFVLAVLLLVFRSIVAALIPLAAVIVSVAISRGVIALASEWGLPVSAFTESFLVAVLFGAGTDYGILMVQRFREELALDGNREAALGRTLKGVGRTVVYSAATVWLAFLLIGFARFGLYQSAVGVSIGVAVTLAAGLTLTPALLLLSGRALFWPGKMTAERAAGASGAWTAAARFTAGRPRIVLLGAVILLAPLVLLFQGERTFDDIADIDPHFESVAGYRQVQQSFGAGEMFPVTLAVTSSGSMRTPSALAAFEQASAAALDVPGVRQVRNAARPLGEGLASAASGTDGKASPGMLDNLLRGLPDWRRDPGKLAESLKSLASGAAPLSGGLIGLVPAWEHLKEGLDEIRPAMPGSASGSDGKQVFEELLQTEGVRQALDHYLSADGKTAKFEVILGGNPFSAEAMNSAADAAAAVRESLKGSALPDAQVFADGVTARYDELRGISFRDFVRTALLVLAGIFVLLTLLLRSIWVPMYVLLTLCGNYLVTMGLLEFLFVRVLGYPGLSWTVSFFLFLILVALGVDYSIFLLARFREEYGQGDGAKTAMARAMAKTGGVIVSAAVIMGGTFGALWLSGAATLMQIGTGTLIGLALYALVFMPFVVPAFAFLLGEANFLGLTRQDALPGTSGTPPAPDAEALPARRGKPLRRSGFPPSRPHR